MIWQLIKKDFTYLMTSLKSLIGSIIVIGLFLPMVGIGFGIAMPAMVCYVGFYGILAYEERSKMQLLNAALPVTRKEICLAKYIYAFLIIGFAMILSLIGSLISSAANGTVDTLLSEIPLYMTLMGVSALIYISIILPCVFYFGTIKARYMLMVIYILMFIVATQLNFHGVPNVLGTLTHTGSMIVLLWGVGIGICLISIVISLRIWNKKDLN